MGGVRGAIVDDELGAKLLEDQPAAVLGRDE